MKNGGHRYFFDLNYIKAKKPAILKRHGCHGNDSDVIFVRKMTLL